MNTKYDRKDIYNVTFFFYQINAVLPEKCVSKTILISTTVINIDNKKYLLNTRLRINEIIIEKRLL